MFRRLSALAFLPLLAACSASMPSLSMPNTPLVSGTPAPTALSGAMMPATPAEMLLSVHYRRSAASQQTFAPLEAFIREAITSDKNMSVDDKKDAETFLAEIKNLRSADLIVAVDAKPLKDVNELEMPQVLSKVCVAARVQAEPGMLATALHSPPAQQGVTVKTQGDATFAWTDGCATMPSYAGTDAITASISKLPADTVTFLTMVHPGHALLHDPILWKEIQTKFDEGVQESLYPSDNPQLTEKIYTRFTSFVTHLNIWHVAMEADTAMSSWTLTPDRWTADHVFSAKTPAAADLVRRSMAGSIEAGVLMLSDTVIQKVDSSVSGNTAHLHVSYDHPDPSVLLSGSGSSFFLLGILGSGASTLFEGAQMKAREAMMRDEQSMPPNVMRDGLQDSGIPADVPRSMSVSSAPIVPPASVSVSVIK